MSFFVAGGTVPPGSPSYVERSADRELFEALMAGEYCYVLNSRQMGKSSLAVRTIAKLNEAGVRTAFVDLTKIGGTTSTPEQWYAGLLLETGRAFGLRTEAAVWLREHRDVGPAQRLLSFLQEEVTSRLDTPLVLMVDEIDAVRSLPFPTDEFFAGLRQLHNGRASDPALRRLTVCLLGAALPSDLIRDPRTTPFNVGRRIELRDFTEEETAPFAAVLGAETVRKAMRWTGGHPFLTQTLCAEVQAGGDADATVAARYLDARARESDTNLADVGRRLLGEGDPNVGDAERADTLSLYERMLRGKPVVDDEANPAAARIKMSGIARLQGGRLRVRNEIYRRVFGPAWIRENMPGQELRRQRRAFWRGALRTGGVATAVVVVISALAFSAVRNARAADAASTLAQSRFEAARYDAYVASMRTLPLMEAQKNLTEIESTLERLKDDPARGWEWDYWYHRSHLDVGRVTGTHEVGIAFLYAFTGDGKSVVVGRHDGSAALMDLASGREIRTFNTRADQWVYTSWYQLADRDRYLVVWHEGGRFATYDVATGRLLREANLPDFMPGTPKQGREPSAGILGFQKGDLVRLDVRTLTLSTVWKGRQNRPANVLVSRDGRLVSWMDDARLIVFDLVEKKVRWRRVIDGEHPLSAWSPDGRYLMVTYPGNRVQMIETATQRLLWEKVMSLAEVQSITFSERNDRAILSTLGREVKIFDPMRKGAVVDRISEGAFAGYVPGDKRFWTFYWDLRIYDPSRKHTVPELSLGWGLNPNISADGRLWSWGLRTNAIDLTDPQAKNLSPKTWPSGMWFTDSGNTVWFGRERHRSAMVFGTKMKFGGTVPASEDGPFFDRSPDGKTVAMPLAGNRIGLYRFAKDLTQVKGMTMSAKIDLASPGRKVRFTPDGRSLVATESSGRIGLWSLDDPKRPKWQIRPGAISIGGDLDFSPDGKRLAVARDDDRGTVFDLETGRFQFDMIGHSNTLTAIAWSPDGSRLATGCSDQTVRIWDGRTGRELTIVGTHASQVREVRFLPGGRTLASVDIQGVVKLWMTEDRR